MQTLGDIQADDIAITMMSVLAVFALYALYSTKKEKDLNLKIVATIMIVVTISMFSFQKYEYNSNKNRVLNRFSDGKDIICKFNDDRDIVISKKRGYELKNKFFIKDETAIKLANCYSTE